MSRRGRGTARLMSAKQQGDRHITVSRDGPLAVMTIRRPPLNLWDAEMSSALGTALDEVQDGAARALLIRAEGRVFTGGVDVHAFVGVDASSGARMARELMAHTHRVSALPIPTVLAAHALCLTWGFELALACDLFLAAEQSRFGLVERVVALSPFMGGTQRLALRAGPARAKEFVMTGELYDADTMAAWGVVNRVLPTEDFDDAARAFAGQLAGGPTLAHAVTKELVDVAVTDSLAAADEIVPQRAGALFSTDDVRRGITSFLTEGPGNATYNGS